MLETIRNWPLRVKIATLVLIVVWCAVFLIAPTVAIGLATVISLMWAIFTIINYLTD